MAVLDLDVFVGGNAPVVVQEHATNLLAHLESQSVHTTTNNTTTARGDDIRDVFVDMFQLVNKCFPKSQMNSKTLDTTSSVLNDTYILTDADVKSLKDAIRRIDGNGWLEIADPHVSGLAKITILYVTAIVLHQISQMLMDTTVNSLNDINYYESVLGRKYLVLLYFIQTLPCKIYDLVLKVKKMKVVNNVGTNTLVEIPQWIPDFLKETYGLCVKYVKVGVGLVNSATDEFIKSPSSFLIEKQKDSRSLLSTFWKSTFQLPYYYSKYELEQKRKRIRRFNKANITRLGYILTNVPEFEEYESNGEVRIDLSIIGNLHKLLNDEGYKDYQRNDSIDLLGLFEVIDTDIPNFQAKLNTQVRERKIPSFWTRNWPIIVPLSLFMLSHVPSTVRNVRLLITDPQTRKDLVNYMRGLATYAFDTTASFWRNWIIDPVNNILKTIRHDDSSEIALMSQQSLDSDLKSLERMVIDYVHDLHKSEGNNIDLSHLQEAVKSGDMTVIMSDYEKELRTPIKSVLTGQMLRNILIQIQKTKVDGSLALSGVDRILKSQELVFGVVAASPSLIILWTLKNSFMKWYSGESANSSKNMRKAEIKMRIRRSLGTVEKLVDYMVVNEREMENSNSAANDVVDYYKSGLVFIEVKNLKKLATQLLPKPVNIGFCKDIDDIVDHDLKNQYKLLTVQRIWNVYGSYFR